MHSTINSSHKLWSQQTPLEIIKNGLSQFLGSYMYTAFLFGSRARNEERPGSDRDIGIESKHKKITPIILNRLRAYFDETPLSVDIVDFSIRDTEFKKMAYTTRIAL